MISVHIFLVKHVCFLAQVTCHFLIGKLIMLAQMNHLISKFYLTMKHVGYNLKTNETEKSSLLTQMLLEKVIQYPDMKLRLRNIFKWYFSITSLAREANKLVFLSRGWKLEYKMISKFLLNIFFILK